MRRRLRLACSYESLGVQLWGLAASATGPAHILVSKNKETSSLLQLRISLQGPHQDKVMSQQRHLEAVYV